MYSQFMMHGQKNIKLKCDLFSCKLISPLTDWYEWSSEFLQLMGLFLLAERLWAFQLGFSSV